ncbi:TOX high mobility group box family member 3-like [Nylanderia fulva]|uniref:TOX high mobility group box family member 3-like n=1 Tax=Nylanderia fulva TaxID=613905 RepID=UPI0010FB35AE|nr:TOX high mobility group box family member 3-like [Nylanderia fulva]
MSTDTSMELVKAKLSDLSLLLLRAEGRKYGIILPSQDKDRWIDEILDHIIRQEKLQLEKNSEQTETTMKEQNPSHSDVSGNLKENHPSSNLSFKIDSQDQASTNTQPQSYSSLKEQIELQKEQMDQQKDMLQQLVKQQYIMQQMFMSMSVSKTSTLEQQHQLPVSMSQHHLPISTQHQLPVSMSQHHLPISTQHQLPVSMSQHHLPISTQHQLPVSMS